MKRYCILTLVLVIIAALSLPSFAEEKVNSLQIDLIYPQKSNSPQRVLDVSTEPVIISGKVPVTIPKEPSLKDAEENRYLVEYFIDDILAYETNGLIEGMANPSFNWLLDTTRYKDGKHKMVVNYWDSKGPSAIGIKYFIIENPISLEDLLNE